MRKNSKKKKEIIRISDSGSPRRNISRLTNIVKMQCFTISVAPLNYASNDQDANQTTTQHLYPAG